MNITHFLSPDFLIKTFGLLGIFFIVFAESGLLFGFFLPGDSLLLTAGLFASRGDLNIVLLVLLSGAAAILGDTVGYWFGRKTGSKLFQKEDSRLFKKSHIEKAQAFYEKHGGKTIILARFMPFIRTFAPIVAGAAKMNYAKFAMFNIVGGVVWGIGLPLVGFGIGTFLRDRFTPEQVDKYFLFLVVGVIILSVAPTIFHMLKDKDSRKHLMKAAKDFIYSLPGITK